MNQRGVLLAIIMLMIIDVLHAQKLPKEFPINEHPRLLLTENDIDELVNDLKKSLYWNKLHVTILDEAKNMLGHEPVVRAKKGRTIIAQSREAFRRIFFLSYSWRLSGDSDYLKRAKKELLVACAFEDWNPTVFLDVAEMTMAVAIGYDWLYHELSESERKLIREAIVEKGIKPSFINTFNSFLNFRNNWNQVCNAGMVFGALAVYEDYPELAYNTIERTLQSIKLPMEEYKPDGAYPEGQMYWVYGTTYNILMISAVEGIYGTDFGLSDLEGFLNTGSFYVHMLGPTGKPFNWSDAINYANINPAVFWLAAKTGDWSILWHEKKFLKNEDYTFYRRSRLLPAVILFGSKIRFNEIKPPSEKFYSARGRNPVAIMRSSWTDPNAVFLGFKLGSANVGHGHMDVGSFVMEADGVRWAIDLGMQDYYSLESKNIQLWNRSQGGQRWAVFRLNNFGHNTLTVDGKLHNVDGYANMENHSDSKDFQYAISNLTDVFGGSLHKIVRGVGIYQGDYVIIRDEIEALDKATKVEWQMVTPAKVALEENKAILTKDGKKLHLIVQSPQNIKMKVEEANQSNVYDARNPGVSIVGFEFEIAGNQTEEVQVLLVPEGSMHSITDEPLKLMDWGNK